MKEWLLGITAIAILSVLIEILIGEGKMKKYVMGVVRVALVFAMIVPILNIFGEKFDFSFNTETPKQSVVDEKLLMDLTEDRVEYTERSLENDLKNIGVDGSAVNIICGYADGKANIEFVNVDLSSAVISSAEENILLTDKIKSIVKKRISVSEDRIAVYGFR